MAATGEKEPLEMNKPTTSVHVVKTADLVHGDEAAKVLGTYDGEEDWTPDEEKMLVRKVDRKLLVMMCVAYALQNYDKALLGQAVSKITSKLHSFVTVQALQLMTAA
jgi:hypothetical protein